jgi:hypothetical protein
MRLFSLAGICMHVVHVTSEYDKRARETECNFRTKQVAAVSYMPQLRKFPYPVQLLLMGEIRGAEDLDDRGDLSRHGLDDEVKCGCLFYRRYQLSCRHILHYHMIFGYLRDEHWEAYAFMFEECGFEIYETASKTYANKEMFEEIGVPARRKLEIREVMDQLQNRYYRLEEEMEGWPEVERDQAIRTWIYELERITGPVRMQAASEMISMLSMERQEAIKESQAQYS